MSVDVGLLIDAFSGVLLTALGLFVATRRPRRLVNMAFAVFSIGWGVIFAALNLANLSGTYPLISTALSPLGVAAGLAIVVVVHRFPRRLDAPWWVRSLAWLPLIALPIMAIVSWRLGRIVSPQEGITLAHVLGLGTLWGGMLFALIVLAWGGARTAVQGEAEWTRHYALVTVALSMDLGIGAGIEAVGRSDLGLSLALVLGPVALSWLVAMARSPSATRRLARHTGLTILALPLVGMLSTPLLGGYPAANDAGIHGIARTMTVLVLAYAILRYQLLALDVKVKWTIKQSTLAAIFIATFFVVSEGAAALFSETTGSTVIGILAAGALVFAIVPLQRFAERVSERAMPGVRPVDEMDEDQRLETYRRHVAVAWADGKLSGDELRMLEVTRESLGLDVELARRIEREEAP